MSDNDTANPAKELFMKTKTSPAPITVSPNPVAVDAPFTVGPISGLTPGIWVGWWTEFARRRFLFIGQDQVPSTGVIDGFTAASPVAGTTKITLFQYPDGTSSPTSSDTVLAYGTVSII